ncbi:MAG: PKD domain-containing protein, partial [Gammaproteobacteria bacterium]|nr:PKD domain-containing protein [Gammaproteobacteria bacterium]
MLGQSTSFTATVAAGSNVTYSWSFGDGNTALGQTVNHAFAADGTYTVTLLASNSLGSEIRQVLITITNEAPVADANIDQNVLVGEVVTLDGLSSTDEDGHLPLSYGWRQSGGPLVVLNDAASATPSFTAPGAAAVLAFQLVVTDTFGLASEPDTVLIVVRDINPGAVQAANNGPTTLGNTTVLSATANGTNLQYEWDFGDGQTGTGQSVNHIYANEGVYIASVRVSNTTDEVGIAMTGVTIVNEAPVADAGLDVDVPVTTLVVLDASASFDPDGHMPLSFQWQQIGGSPV